MPNLETRGRKALSPELRKAPQATIKINETILPFVKELKGNLKKGKVTKKTIARLFNVLNNKWEQVNAVDNEVAENIDVKSLENEIQRLNDELLKVHKLNAVKPLESTERLELVEKYHVERNKVVTLEGKDRSNRGTIMGLNSNIDRLKHLEHGCQALKSDGCRCTRPAVTTVDWQRIEIHVCAQHSKLLKR